MNEEHSREKCCVCQAYLFEEDDTVYCPECGAPHHRDCYNALGHCAQEHLHGTSQSYDCVKAREEEEKTIEPERSFERSEEERDNGETKCGMCGESYNSELRYCPECGAPNMSRMSGGFSQNFDFLGGIPADMDIGDGVTADEAKRFVLSNTQRYIPKFAAFAAGVRSSWNWMAFFFPCAWYLSRKMYKNGAVVGLLSVVFSLLTAPFVNAIYYIDLSGARTYAEMGQVIYEYMPQIGAAVVAAAAIGAILQIALRIYAGVRGDYSYKKFTVETVKEIKAESDDIDEDYRRKGGVSFFGMIIGFFVVQYLPSIIAMFI